MSFKATTVSSCEPFGKVTTAFGTQEWLKRPAWGLKATPAREPSGAETANVLIMNWIQPTGSLPFRRRTVEMSSMTAYGVLNPNSFKLFDEDCEEVALT